MNFHLTGLIAATFTASHPDGSVNLDAIPHQAAMAHEDGMSGVFICGSTGEGVSLTLRERVALAAEWDKARGDLKLVVHVAHACLEDARELAAHAQSVGADAIAAMYASPFPPATVDELVTVCAGIASAAPDLPFYLYHIPSLSRVQFKVHDFLQRGAERIPNLAGCKFTFEDLWDFERCVALEGGRFDMLFGRDEILLAGAALGARGFVGATYNLAAPHYRRILHAFEAGDRETARQLQATAAEMVTVLLDHGGLPAMKALMSTRGLDLGPMRPPFKNINAAEIQAMAAKLDGLGYFEWT